MGWMISVKIDEDQTDVGTVRGVWTDINFGDFVYSMRVKANVAGAATFVADAIAARNTWQVKMQDNKNKADYLIGLINTEDPQVEE